MIITYRNNQDGKCRSPPLVDMVAEGEEVVVADSTS